VPATKAFGYSNSQAIHIPAELAYEATDIELALERIGDELRIWPVRQSLAGVLEKFARFGPEFMAEGRGEHNQAARIDAMRAAYYALRLRLMMKISPATTPRPHG
jgi:antitoxin VapB